MNGAERETRYTSTKSEWKNFVSHFALVYRVLRSAPLTRVFCRLSRRTLLYQTRNSNRKLFKSYRGLLEVSNSCHAHLRSHKGQMIFVLYFFLNFKLSYLSFREVIKFTRDVVIFNNTTFPTSKQTLCYIVQIENHPHIERIFQLSVGKSKAITLGYHKRHWQYNEPIKLQANASSRRHKARETVW